MPFEKYEKHFAHRSCRCDTPPSNGGDKNKIEKGELQLVLDLHRSQPRG